MLKRLKQSVTEAVNAVNESTSGHSSSMGSNEEKEGFVCPQCMNIFPSPHELSNHFLTHTQESPSNVPMRVDNPNFDGTTVNGRRKSELESMPPEKIVDELQSQLKDEKWYSSELKKELERINSVIAQSNHVPEEEVPYLMQQIQVLEAGKSMVTQRLMELEKEGMGLRRTLESEKGEKGDIMKKLKDLTTKIREITDENEKHKVEKEQLSAELTILRNSAQKLEKELVNLNQILQERPSEDDVLVLKNELINAQKLMDEITKEKEVELSEQQNTIRMLSQEREKQHIFVQNLERKLAENGSNTVEHVARVSNLESTMESVEKEKETVKRRNEELESKVNELTKSIDSLRLDLSSALEAKIRLDESIEMNTRQAEILNEINQSRLEELNDKMKLMIGENKKLEGDLHSIEERANVQNDNIKDLEQSNLDLTNEVSSLNLLLEKEKEKLKRKKEEVDSREKELRENMENLEEMKMEKEKMKSEMESLKMTIEGIQKENGIAKENAQLLRSQISDGESGMKTLMDQLNEEKERLAKDVVMMGETLKNEKESSSSRIGDIEKKIREIENEKEKEVKKLKEEIEGMNEKLVQSEDEILRKSDRFSEIEKEIEEERRKGGERMGKMKEVIEGLKNEKDDEKTKKEEAIRMIERLEKEVKEKERQVGENRGKIEDALRRVKDAEEKAKKLEEELSVSSASLASTSQSEKEISKKMEEERKKADELSVQLQSTKDEMESMNEELIKLKQESEEAEKHWKIKLAEKESIIAGNEKMNEELIEKEKERERELKERRKEIEDKEKTIASLKDQLEEEGIKMGEIEKENGERLRNMEALQESLMIIYGENEELEKIMKEHRDNGEESKEKIESLTSELIEEKKKVEEMIDMATVREKKTDEELKRKEGEITLLRVEMEGIQSSLMYERETRIRIEEEVKEKTEEMDSFQTRITGFEEESASFRREVERLEKELIEKEEKCEKIKRETEEKVSQLEEKKREEEQIMNEIMKENDEKEKKIDQLSTRIISMESNICEMEEEKNRLKEEIEERKAELEVEVQRGSEREVNHLRIEGELRSENEKIRRSMESAISDRSDMEKRMKESNEGMELLTVKNMELVQAAAAFDEEKSALIERCLNTESDLDFERERALENKHRFDEAISAMHELGRANQSLQMDMNKMTGRKWLDDSEALNCTHCAKLFSLTVRKHHCRVCGFIFCNNCSNKTVKIASHKSPVRVCDHCHSDVSSR